MKGKNFTLVCTALYKYREIVEQHVCTVVVVVCQSWLWADLGLHGVCACVCVCVCVS